MRNHINQENHSGWTKCSSWRSWWLVPVGHTIPISKLDEPEWTLHTHWLLGMAVFATAEPERKMFQTEAFISNQISAQRPGIQPGSWAECRLMIKTVLWGNTLNPVVTDPNIMGKIWLCIIVHFYRYWIAKRGFLVRKFPI
jgi:hypothetical protein